MLKDIIKSLMPGADEEGVEQNANLDSTPVDESPSGDDDLYYDLPDDNDVAPQVTAKRNTEADDRLARLEAEVERRGRLAEQYRVQQSPSVDPEFQKEEDRLRSSDVSDLERWQIQSNRQIRQMRQEAQQARMEAQDASDQLRFQSGFSSDPRRSKYAQRVEEAVQSERAAGRNASREAVYYFMLGKDIAEGKLKPKAKGTTKAPEVHRGRTPAVRSDVQGRGRPTSERDKLRSRLENMNI